MGNGTKYKIGDRVGTLVILENLEGEYWWCRCDCGREEVYTSSELKNRKTCSKTCKYYRCGGGKAIKHGDRSGGLRTRLYRIWGGMVERCECGTSERYNDYGGRNIRVCKEWRQDYSAFKKWALENGYKENLTIDRIDNDGDYCPENCRWATYKEQGNNRRNNIVVEVGDAKKTLSQLSEEFGIKRDTLRTRYEKCHDIDYILRPVRKKITRSGCNNSDCDI